MIFFGRVGGGGGGVGLKSIFIFCTVRFVNAQLVLNTFLLKGFHIPAGKFIRAPCLPQKKKKKKKKKRSRSNRLLSTKDNNYCKKKYKAVTNLKSRTIN